jgi:phytoene dehydrogenase-like protein
VVRVGCGLALMTPPADSLQLSALLSEWFDKQEELGVRPAIVLTRDRRADGSHAYGVATDNGSSASEASHEEALHALVDAFRPRFEDLQSTRERLQAWEPTRSPKEVGRLLALLGVITRTSGPKAGAQHDSFGSDLLDEIERIFKAGWRPRALELVLARAADPDVAPTDKEPTALVHYAAQCEAERELEEQRLQNAAELAAKKAAAERDASERKDIQREADEAAARREADAQRAAAETESAPPAAEPNEETASKGT